MFLEFAIPPQVIVMFLGAVPFFELRGALPLGMILYEMPFWEAMFWSILGNIIPFFVALVFFEKTVTFLCNRSPRIKGWIGKGLNRIRLSLQKEVEKYGALALVLVVIIPLPVTGTVSAALASYIFDLPKRKAFLSALLGLVISAGVIVILTVTATSVFESLLFKN